MSVHLTSPLWFVDIPTTPKFVLSALCDHGNDEGRAYPSVDRLAAYCGVSRRTVQKALRTLIDDGIISRAAYPNGGARATEFLIDIEAAARRYGFIDIKRPPKAMLALMARIHDGADGVERRAGVGEGVHDVRPYGRTRCAPTGEPGAPQGRTSCTRGVNGTTPDPSGTVIEKSAREADDNAAALAARWQRAIAETAEHFGAGARRTIEALQPIRDAGGEIVVSARTRRSRDEAQRSFAPRLSQALGQPVLIVCKGAPSPFYPGRDAFGYHTAANVSPVRHSNSAPFFNSEAPAKRCHVIGSSGTSGSVLDAREIWAEAEPQLREAVGDDEYDQWFRVLQPESIGPDGLHLRAPTRFLRDHTEKHHQQTIAQVLGREVVIDGPGGGRAAS